MRGKRSRGIHIHIKAGRATKKVLTNERTIQQEQAMKENKGRKNKIKDNMSNRGSKEGLRSLLLFL